MKGGGGGCEELTSRTLKIQASVISHSLSYIYNHSLYVDIFHDYLTISVVKPLYEQGEACNFCTSSYDKLQAYVIIVFYNVFERAV
jgi:hypothetical protein